MIKLNPEQSEHLSDLLTHDGYKVICEVVLPQLIADMERRLTAINLETPNAERELLINKARLEGAAKLAREVQDLRTKRDRTK